MMTPLRAQVNQQRFVQMVSDVHRTCGWSLREVAALTGLDHSYVWQIVNGRRRPSRDTLILLCLYGWSLDLPEANQLLESCGHKPLVRRVHARSLLSH